MFSKNMQELAHALFEYIKEVCQLTQQKVLDVEKQPGFVAMRKLDDSSCIKLFSRDKVVGNAESESDVLLTFHKPDFTQCPAPDASLERWLVPGWYDYRKPLEHRNEIELSIEKKTDAVEETAPAIPDGQLFILDSVEQTSQISLVDEQNEEHPKFEYFTDDPERVALFDQWYAAREAWVLHEKHTAQIRGVFNDLFDMYNQYRQTPDTMEIVVGNGYLTDKQNKDIKHPLLMKRVNLTLDPVKNTLTVSDTEEPASINLPMFSIMEDVNVDVIRPLEKSAEDNDIHPLDHNDGGNLLKSVAHQLHASSRFLDDGEDAVRIDERIVIRWDPYIFLRKRPDGTIKAIQSILDALSEGAEIPGSLIGILGGFSEPVPDDLDEGILAPDGTIDIWTEPKHLPLEAEDILLPKLVNREQMQIVRQIEHSSAVLVQGPPGTGKTHTIANLLGHFLAEGKTVLVTSHTSKALTVLKEKVPQEMQALCVSVFGDNRADMEESINTIIDRTSGVSFAAQQARVNQLRRRRHETLAELQKARDLVYAIRHKEFEPIVFEGSSWSPSQAAEYVAQHESLIGLIPGDIRRNAPFPLTQQDIEWLYASNALLTVQEEQELTMNLPDTEDLMTPQQLVEGIDLQNRLNDMLQTMNSSGRVLLAWKPQRYTVVDTLSGREFAKQGDCAAEESLRAALAVYEDAVPAWAVFAMSDGAEEGLSRKRWEQLLRLIDEAFAKGQPVLEKQLKRPIKVIASSHTALLTPYMALLEDAEKHGHVKKGILTKKEKRDALDAITIGGAVPESLNDIKSVLAYFELLELRKQLGQLWDSLIAANGACKFAYLGDDPERSCHKQAKMISFWLNWEKGTRKELCTLAEKAGIGESVLKPLTGFVSMTEDKAAQILNHITNQLIPAVHLLHLVNALYSYTHSKENTLKLLMDYQKSVVCGSIRSAIDEESVEQYELAINSLTMLLKKTEVQQRRSKLLAQIAVSAPEWSEAIQHRNGCHSYHTVPEDILTAWKVRQLACAVNEITGTSLLEGEKRVTDLTLQFRKDTEKLATAQAWCYLQKRIDSYPKIRQDLTGWKLTMGRLGKGTGKRAPALRIEARKLMMECQKAVPAWIMPVSGVMNSIDPTTTKFDVIIVDEASQSDITASVILYMGRKIIIVGDDEQVSPMAVGLDETKMKNLMDMLIKDKIPNAHLWDAKTSLYDIASQVYRPLMLREHFRCVPDIIGYSNMLSYNGKIKPLREAGSSPFKTATISYRVQGIRNGRSKTNEEEADAIVALIKACLEQPEYADKTFGVISMLGDDQVKLVTRKLADAVPLVEHEKHHILCGNASNFQGDERDIIFLSLVDSNGSDGPLSMESGEGQGSNGKSMKQRYNVAVSRAKDQLWVVHSLDVSADLKPGDMRRRLLEYVSDPHAAALQAQSIDEASDSPFEAEIATALVAQGYHITQQWPVGAYRIDMVVMSGNKRIAIECDGERWHSGEEKIREDMERQSLLERLGWHFIRIRGSEYYRGKDQAISRIIAELKQYDIVPEAFDVAPSTNGDDPLLNKIKQRATQLIAGTGDMEVQPPPASHDNNTARTRSGMAKNQTVMIEESMIPITIVEESVMPKTRFVPPIPVQHPTQVTMNLPDDDVLAAFQIAGFTCIDNRKKSDILWVLFDKEKVDRFTAIELRYNLKPSLEKRGAVATNGKPAWRVKT